MSTESSGLYRPYFTEEERRYLELVPHDDLSGEINLRRRLLIIISSHRLRRSAFRKGGPAYGKKEFKS